MHTKLVAEKIIGGTLLPSKLNPQCATVRIYVTPDLQDLIAEKITIHTHEESFLPS